MNDDERQRLANIETELERMLAEGPDPTGLPASMAVGSATPLLVGVFVQARADLVGLLVGHGSYTELWKRAARLEWRRLMNEAEAYSIRNERHDLIAHISIQMRVDVDLELVHEKSRHHKKDLEKSPLCGCFYCLRTYAPTEIHRWARSTKEDTELTCAVCPYCTVDAVLPSNLVPLTDKLLRAMHDRWFRISKSQNPPSTMLGGP